VRSATWVSSKWPGRAPGGHVLIRASLSVPRESDVFDEPDDRLIDRVHHDLRGLLDITASPVMARVYRRPRAMPQLVVGHLERMAAIERRLASLPGVFLTASGFRGVGLPDCITDAQAVACRAGEYVAASS
jgi:oxygen-dependent protoporphyrinogen oxidase